MNLTIYSKDYDKNDNVVNDGYSNVVFVEDELSGISFSNKEKDNIERALNYIVNEKIDINEILFNYVDDNGEKRFKRFIIKE